MVGVDGSSIQADSARIIWVGLIVDSHLTLIPRSVAMAMMIAPKTMTLLWPPCVADADIVFLPYGFFFFVCLEGKGENYQVCCVQYCAQQLCTVRCTHI